MKITVVGCGMVGSTYVYRLALSSIPDKIILIDIDTQRAQGELEDISQSTVFAKNVEIVAGSWSEAKDSDLVVITAGLPRQAGMQSRLELIQTNAKIFAEFIPQIAKVAPDAMYLVVSNPADVMTLATIKYGKLDPSRVFSTGTLIDTARFRYFIGQELKVSPQSVEAYVIGEHGDSQVPVFSQAKLAGLSLEQYVAGQNKIDWQSFCQKVTTQTVTAGPRICQNKRATYYGIASAMFELTKALTGFQPCILPISSKLNGQFGLRDVCLSLPTLISKRGIEAVLEPALSDQEVQAFVKSGQIIKEASSVL